MTSTQAAITTQFNVTLEQIDRCDRILDLQRHKVFYQVESQTTDQVYHVEFSDLHHRLECTPCPSAGETCWHMRAALATEAIFKQQQQDEQFAFEREEAYKLEQLMHELERSQAELDAYLAEVDQRQAERAIA